MPVIYKQCLPSDICTTIFCAFFIAEFHAICPANLLCAVTINDRLNDLILIPAARLPIGPTLLPGAGTRFCHSLG